MKGIRKPECQNLKNAFECVKFWYTQLDLGNLLGNGHYVAFLKILDSDTGTHIPASGQDIASTNFLMNLKMH